MNNKVKTPAITVILYLAGFALLVVSAFMLYAAIMYTMKYVASYDSSIKDMLPNSLQYIIGQFVPYFALALISFGAGKAAKGGVAFAKDGSAGSWDDSWDEVFPMDAVKREISGVTEDIKKLSTDLEEIKVTGAIKLEELERRQAYRVEDSRNQILEALSEEGEEGEGAETEAVSLEDYICNSPRPRRFIK